MLKKVLSIMLAAMVTIGAVGCSSSGKKFKKTQEKLITAAENCCDAAPMGKSLKKKYAKRNFRIQGSTEDQGIYTTYDSDYLANYDLDEEIYNSLDSEEVKNITAFAKSGKGGMIVAELIELREKDTARELYDYYVDMIDLDTKKHRWKRSGEGEFATDEDTDDTLAFIAVIDGSCSAGYIHVDGNLFTVVSFSGNSDDDILEEYYDFMREAGFTDMEALLNGDLDD